MRTPHILWSSLLLIPMLTACNNATTSEGPDSLMGGSSSVAIIELTGASSAMSEKSAMSAASSASSKAMMEGQQSSGTQTVQTGCKVAGCSGQLCVDAAMGDMVTTCEYREEYDCYKTARCEKQSTGVCGWTVDPALDACIKKAQAK